MEQESAGSGDQGNMRVIEGEFERNKQNVIEMLINNCMTVDTSIPRVVIGRFDWAWWTTKRANHPTDIEPSRLVSERMLIKLKKLGVGDDLR